MLMVVVLPAPFGPRRPKSSPPATEKETRSTAVTSPNLRVSSSTRMSSVRAAMIPPLYGLPRRKTTNGRAGAWRRRARKPAEL